MSGSLDYPVTDKGPDRIHVGGMGKTDNHVLAGKVARERFKLPAHQEIEKSSGKTQYLLHMRSFLCESARSIKSVNRYVNGYRYAIYAV